MIVRVRRAFRRLVQRPSLLITGVFSLSICFGVNAALLSFLASVLWLPPAGLAAAGRLVTVLERDQRGNVQYPTEARLRALERVRFKTIQLASYVPTFLTLAGRDGGSRLTAELVSSDYFRVLGTGIQRGRTLVAFDSVARDHRIPAIISSRLWRERFDSAETTIGQDLTLGDDQHLTIVGIAPDGFHGAEALVQADVWLPTARMPEAGRWSRIVGRLAPEASARAAAAELGAVWPRLADSEIGAEIRRRHPTHIEAKPLRAGLHPESNSLVRALLGGASAIALFALILACANLSGLEFSRSLGRQREIAIRRALGESLGSILIDVAMDLFLVFALGILGGLFVAPYAGQLLIRLLATPFPFALAVQINWHTAIGVVLLMLIAAALSAFVPALRAARVDPSSVLRADNVSATTSRGVARAQGAFVIVQVALALGILSCALSAISTAHAALARPLGVSSPSTLVAVPVLPSVGDRAGSVASTTDNVADRLVTNTGAISAAFAYAAPGSGGLLRTAVRPADGNLGRRQPADSELAGVNVVTPTFFAVMGRKLLAGRDFSPSDGMASERVAIVSRRFASVLFGTQQALDRRFVSSTDSTATFRVIGVADDISYDATSDTVGPLAYFPAAQFGDAFGRRNVILRLRGPLTPSARHLIDSTMRQANLWTGEPASIDELRGAGVDGASAIAKLLTAAAVLCVVLVMAGLFGLVAYNVRQRVREIGVRLALGASAGDVVWLFTARVVEILLFALILGALLLWLFEQSGFLPTAALSHLWLSASIAAVFLIGVAALTSGVITYSQARRPPNLALRDL